MEVERCQGTTKEGRPCNAKPLPGETLCPWHSPAWADKRTEWSAKGGTNRSNKSRAKKALPNPVLSPMELQGVISKAIHDVLDGRLEPGPANAAAALSRALVAIREATDLEQRLEALERAAGLGERRIS